MRIRNAALEELRAMIDRADYLYHTGVEDSGWTDHKYDQMKIRLKELCPDDPRLTRVGPPEDFIDATPLAKVQHVVPMPSLNNAMDVGEYEAWMSKLPSGLNTETATSHKMDGIAIDLRYEAGHFVRALTRGPQGATGQDVTHSALRFEGIPRELTEPVTVNIRGEAVMYISAFDKVNEQRTSRGEDLFENPRNAAAGIIQRSSGEDTEYITFHAHNILGYPESGRYEIKTKSDQYELLHGWGFESVPYCICEGFDDVLSHWEALGKHRGELQYWIDGLVVFVNDLEVVESMGITSRRPKAAIAFKWPSEQAEARVEEIIITVGRTGKISPTAHLTPVRLCGTTVSNAFLHNQANIDKLGLDSGDTVIVEKGGEINPQIVRVTQHAGPEDVTYKLPTTCPVCSGRVGHRMNIDKTETVDLFCLNDDCPAKGVGRVERWISSLEIKGVGPEILSAMFGVRLVSRVSDLYTLNPIALEGLQLSNGVLGMSRTDSILQEITKTRTLTMPKFLGSLGIPKLGKRRVELILKSFVNNVQNDTVDLCTVETWVNDPEQLVHMAGSLGIPGLADQFCRALTERREELSNLLRIITVEDYVVSQAPTVGSLVGKSFCLTGEMSRPRPQIAKDIVANGGEVISSVRRGLSYLVQADPGSKSAKSEKANKLGIDIIDEAALLEMMEGR